MKDCGAQGLRARVTFLGFCCPGLRGARQSASPHTHRLLSPWVACSSLRGQVARPETALGRCQSPALPDWTFLGRRGYGRLPPSALDGLVPAGPNVLIAIAGPWIVLLSPPILGSLSVLTPAVHSEGLAPSALTLRGSAWSCTEGTSRGPSTPAAACATSHKSISVYHRVTISSSCREDPLSVCCALVARSPRELGMRHPRTQPNMKESCQLEA